jgi:hypothetical protein
MGSLVENYLQLLLMALAIFQAPCITKRLTRRLLALLFLF